MEDKPDCCMFCGWFGGDVKKIFGRKGACFFLCNTCSIIFDLIDKERGEISKITLIDLTLIIRSIVSQSMSVMLNESINLINSNLETLNENILEVFASFANEYKDRMDDSVDEVVDNKDLHNPTKNDPN